MSVSLVNAAGETVDVTADVTLEYDSPAALFAARNTAYVVADADTESTEGKNTAEKRLDPQDMFYVMYYVANRGAGVPVTWSDIIR